MNSKYLDELGEFVGIRSVSADSKRFKEVKKAVDFLKNKLETLGFEISILEKETFPPLLLASKMISKGAKTIGVYAHYDVQPEDPADEWSTEPFQLTQKAGKLFGRGVADDKGHLMQNIFAVEELIKKNELKNNIVFIFEGEEETGSLNFEELVKQKADFLSKIDVFYVTDVGMHEKNIPQIEYGLRGIVYFQLDVEVGKRDLHSGIYGNRAINPIQLVGELLSKMKDMDSGKILIPGFYDKVRKPDQKEVEILKKVARTDKEEMEEMSSYSIISVDKENPWLSSKLYPSMDAHGISSGYTGEGSKTIIPKSASLKFSFRLVEYQDPDEIEILIKEFIRKAIPKGVKYHLQTFGKAAPFYTEIDNEFVKKTVSILKSQFGNEVLFNRSGGSIPAAEILQRLFKKPVILTGFILPDCNLHSPNENFDEEMFWKGIEVLKKIYGST